MAQAHDVSMVTYACGTTCDLTEEHFVNTNASDFLDLLELLSEHHINEDLAEDALQAKKLLFQHLQQREEYLTQLQEGLPVATVDIRTDIIQTLVEEHQKRRQALLVVAEVLEEILTEMSHDRKSELKRYFPQLDKKFTKILSELRDETCPFIVAGETGSGKSQFLNLLTGHVNKDFLPVSNNPSTSCLCAIKYADKDSAKIRAYRTDTDEFVEEAIHEENMAEKLSEFTHQKEHRDKIQYTKVEVGCPLPWLQNGLAIYDTPGCGERAEVTAIVKEMLPKAYGFIYILSTPSAGGIKTANLEEFWVTDSSSSSSKATDILQDSFDPKTAIFVFNKWDLVPQVDQDKVKEYVHTTLYSMFGDNIDLDTQVFYLSATQEAAALKGGYFTKRYKRILKGIESLLHKSFRSRITKYYNYLTKVLRRCQIVLTTFINDSSSIKNTYKELKARLNNLEHLSTEVEADLKKSLQKQTEFIISALKTHIHSDETKERLCVWEEEQCPTESVIWRLLKYEVIEKIQLRIAGEIKRWEHESCIFEKAEDHLFTTFGEKFETLTKTLYHAESALVDKSTDDQALARILREMDKTLQPVHKKSMSLTKKVLLGVAAATIVGGLIAGPIVLAQYIRRKSREQEAERRDWEYFASFIGNKSEYPQMMAEKMEEFLTESLTGNVLREAISEQMTRLAQNYLHLLDEIPTFVEADRKLLRSRKHKKDLDMTDSSRLEYMMMLSKLTKLRQKIEYFFFQHIFRNEVSPQELYLEEKVGSGTFGVIWSAALQPEDQDKSTVFVKKLPVLLSEKLASNALAIMMEHSRLKQIQSDNVIKYYGLCLKAGFSVEEGEVLTPYMVMEHASLTLDMVRDSVKYKGPGMMRSTRKKHTVVLERMAKYMMQIANGLVKMHEEDVVHHGLKPQSILVIRDDGENDTLKLCDFEISIPASECEQVSHIPECTTTKYSAPGRHKFATETAEDLYSFGMIGLELYYGKCLCHMDFLTLDENDGQVTFSGSPFSMNEPPPDMLEALQKCWSHDLTQRPTANYCYDVFLRYAKDWYMGEVASTDADEILQSFDSKHFMIFEDKANKGEIKLCVKDKGGVRSHAISRSVADDGSVRYSMTDRMFKDLNSMVSFYETHNLHDSKDSGLLASR